MNDIGAFFDKQAERYDSAYDDPGSGGRILRRRLADALALIGDGPGRRARRGHGRRPSLRRADRAWVDRLGRRSLSCDGRGGASAPAGDRRSAGRGIDRKAAVRRRDASTPSLPRASSSTRPTTSAARRVELARVLRPGGRAVVSFPNHASPRHLWRGRVLYPAVRAAKRVVPRGRPAPPSARAPLAGVARDRARVGRATRRGAATTRPDHVTSRPRSCSPARKETG